MAPRRPTGCHDGRVSDVLLATCAALPDGEEWAGTNHLPEAFAARGIDARWAVWDDPTVDWSSALVAVRSTWDYTERLEDFLAWARSLPRVLNGADVFEWNTDKAYLAVLPDHGVATVPTRAVRDRGELADAVAAFAGAGPVVVKPSVGAGGVGVTIVEPGTRPEIEGEGPWVVQPLVDSVRTEGETSIFVLDGKVVSQAQKQPADGEIRVHEQYGGVTRPVEVTDEACALALAATAAAESILGRPLDYARVDAMRLPDGTLAVSELEVTEPGLYLEVLPDNARSFVAMVADRLDTDREDS